LSDKTEEKDRIEVLLKVDLGDEESEKAILRYKDYLPLRIVKMDGSRRGSDLDKYANKLAEEAKGKFIWYWTDEARIETQRWEKTFIDNAYMADAFTVIFVNRKGMIGDIYPCISRKWLDTTGRFCGHIAHDCWTHKIAEALPGIVNYQRFDNLEMCNSTFLKQNKEYPHFPPDYDFNSEFVQNELKKDIEKIRFEYQLMQKGN
jgi:hypothetical protein